MAQFSQLIAQIAFYLLQISPCSFAIDRDITEWTIWEILLLIFGGLVMLAVVGCLVCCCVKSWQERNKKMRMKEEIIQTINRSKIHESEIGESKMTSGVRMVSLHHHGAHVPHSNHSQPTDHDDTVKNELEGEIDGSVVGEKGKESEQSTQ